MEILNDLVDRSIKLRSLGLNAVVEMEDILAIAEAFRSLEHRALVGEQGEKTFEDGFCSVRQDRDEWKQRAESAESWVKVAERTMDHQANVITQLGVRAEMAEERANNLNDGWLNAINERDEARARLAELEKQEPAGKFAFEPLAERYHHIKHGEAQHMEPKLPLVKLYTRPAPAINLAELVPPMKDDSIPGKNDSYIDMCDGWNACRAAIIRNIEEAK